jgi:hypothetical protein
MNNTHEEIVEEDEYRENNKEKNREWIYDKNDKKVCNTCGRELLTSNFYKYRRSCKSCEEEKYKKRRKKIKEQNKINPPEPVGTKQCSKCGEIKPLSCFPRNNGLKSGYGSWCKPCSSQKTIFCREKLKEKNKINPPERFGTKRCSKCGDVKDISQFDRNIGTTDGYRSQCKSCVAKVAKKRIEKIKEQNKINPPTTVGTKRCLKCGDVLSLNEFYNCISSLDGFSLRCKKCSIEDTKKYGEKIKEQNRINPPTPVGTKRCSSCGLILSVHDFYKSTRKKDGIDHICKKCKDEQQKKYINNWREYNKINPLQIQNKTCSKCGMLKPITHFWKNSATKDGYTRRCKECISEHIKNGTQRREHKRELNPIKMKICTNCGELKDVEQFTKSKRTLDGYNFWCKKCMRKYREENGSKISAVKKIRYYSNLDLMHEKSRKYRNTPRGRFCHNKHSHERRIKLKEAPGNYTFEDIAVILRQQNYICNICKKPFKKENGKYRYTIDHIVPIDKYGTNTPDNLQLLCRSCNSSKNNKIDKTNIRTYIVAETVPEIKKALKECSK